MSELAANGVTDGAANAVDNGRSGIAANPYVGPVAFERNDRRRLSGRDDDLRRLAILFVAQRIVLLYSPSGAGKTSLVQAKLIPALESKDFVVLPAIRVNQKPAKGSPITNNYVYSTILSLEEGQNETGLERKPGAEERPLDLLLGQEDSDPVSLGFVDLKGYWDRQRKALGNQRAVLFFDQFEEILTVDPHNHEQKVEFFDQLGSILEEDTRLWALFAMREDYIAEIDPYRHLIPGEFEFTYRLELLDGKQALMAIQEPALDAGVNFSEEAAGKLLNELRRVQVRRADGTVAHAEGRFVEPVQLQVVCDTLWQDLRPKEGDTIEPDAVAAEGHVDKALGDFYDKKVAQIAEANADVDQRDIRQWFGQRLINQQGLRSQVMDSPDLKLNPQVIRDLIDAHLIRAEERRGILWYEVAHDRLVKPVIEHNEAWYEKNLSMLQIRADAWNRTNDDGLLLQGNELKEGEDWAKDKKLKDHEQLFLDMSRDREKALRAGRTRKYLIGAAALLVLTVVVLAVVIVLWQNALNQQRIASNNAATATVAQGAAENNAATATVARGQAENNAATATVARGQAEYNAATATVARGQAELAAESEARARATAVAAIASAKLAESNRLAAAAGQALTDDSQLALLLAIEAQKVEPTNNAVKDTLEQALKAVTGDEDVKSLLEQPCRVARRNLTQPEWERFFAYTVPYRRTCLNRPEHETAVKQRQNSDDLDYLAAHCFPSGYGSSLDAAAYDDACQRAIDLASATRNVDVLADICLIGGSRTGSSLTVQGACARAVEFSEEEGNFPVLTEICLAGGTATGDDETYARACQGANRLMGQFQGERLTFGDLSRNLDFEVKLCNAGISGEAAVAASQAACELVLAQAAQALASPSTQYQLLSLFCSARNAGQTLQETVQTACQQAAAEAIRADDLRQLLDICEAGTLYPSFLSLTLPACTAAGAPTHDVSDLDFTVENQMVQFCAIGSEDPELNQALIAICQHAVALATTTYNAVFNLGLCDAGIINPAVATIVQPACQYLETLDPNTAVANCFDSLSMGDMDLAACSGALDYLAGNQDIFNTLDICRRAYLAGADQDMVLDQICQDIVEELGEESLFELADFCFYGLGEFTIRQGILELSPVTQTACLRAAETSAENEEVDLLFELCELASADESLAITLAPSCQLVLEVQPEEQDPYLLARYCPTGDLAQRGGEISPEACARAAELASAKSDLLLNADICRSGAIDERFTTIAEPACQQARSLIPVTDDAGLLVTVCEGNIYLAEMADVAEPACQRAKDLADQSDDPYQLFQFCWLTSLDPEISRSALTACGRAAELAPTTQDVELSLEICRAGVFNESLVNAVQPACDVALDVIDEIDDHVALFDLCQSLAFDQGLASIAGPACQRAVDLAIDEGDLAILFAACQEGALPETSFAREDACRQVVEIGASEEDPWLLAQFCTVLVEDKALGQTFRSACRLAAELAISENDAFLNHIICQEGPSAGLAEEVEVNCKVADVLARPIVLGESVRGTVHPRGGGAWTFEGEAGQPVVIGLDADRSNLDPQLTLLSPAGAVLAEDDDGAGDLNSRIIIVLPETGQYTIFAHGFSDTGGDYRLTLDERGSQYIMQQMPN